MTLALAAIGIVWWLQRQGRVPARAHGGAGLRRFRRRAVPAGRSARAICRCSRRTSRHLRTDASPRSTVRWRRRWDSRCRRSAASNRWARPRMDLRAAADPQPAASRPAGQRLRHRHHGGSGVSVCADGARSGRLEPGAAGGPRESAGSPRRGCDRCCCRWWRLRPRSFWRRRSDRRHAAPTACWRDWSTKGFSTTDGGRCITASARRGAASTRSPSPRSRIVLVSGGETSWIARGYAIAVVVTAVLKLAALIRYRTIRTEKRAYRVPLNVTIGGREWPLGLIGAADTPVPRGRRTRSDRRPAFSRRLRPGRGADGRTRRLQAIGRVTGPSARGIALDEFQLLPSDDVDLRHVGRASREFPRAGPPAARAHASRQRPARRGRPRRRGDDGAARRRGRSRRSHRRIPRATEEERRLLSAVMAAAEREGRAVRLMIVPGVNVFDSVIETALRLQVVGDSHGRIGNAVGRRPGAAARRRLGARQQAVRRRRPPGRLSPARHHRRVSPGRARARAPPRRLRTRPPALARRRPGRWFERAPSRCGARGVDHLWNTN